MIVLVAVLGIEAPLILQKAHVLKQKFSWIF